VLSDAFTWRFALEFGPHFTTLSTESSASTST